MSTYNSYVTTWVIHGKPLKYVGKVATPTLANRSDHRRQRHIIDMALKCQTNATFKHKINYAFILNNLVK